MFNITNIHRLSFLRNDLNELYASLIIKTFGGALVDIFVPIFLIKSGYALNQILFFYIIMYAVWGLIAPFVAKIETVIGEKHLFLARIPFLIIYYLGLSYPVLGMPLYVTALFGAVAGACYGIGLNSIFVNSTKSIPIGKEIGKLKSLPLLSAIIAPLIGAAVYSLFGASILFIVAIIMYILSAVPLLLSKDKRPKVKFTFTHFLRFEKDPGIFFGIMFNEGGLRVINEIIWPMFVFLMLGSVYSVGIAGTLATIAIFFFLLYIGRLSDRGIKGRMIALGALFGCAFWILRIFVQDNMGIFIIAFMGAIAQEMVEVPFGTIFYNLIRNKNTLEMIAYREMILMWGRTVFLGALLLVVNKFFVAFVISAIVSLIYLFINFRDVRKYSS